MTTIEQTAPRMNVTAAGWALSAALVVLFLVLAILATIWPTSAFGQGWVAVFNGTPSNSILGVMKGIITCVLIAWVVAAVFVNVYNRLHARSQASSITHDRR